MPCTIATASHYRKKNFQSYWTKPATIPNSISTTSNKPQNEWKLMQKVLKSSINGIFYTEFDTTSSTIPPLYTKSYNVTIFLKSHYIRKLIRRKCHDRSTQHSFAIFRWKALFSTKNCVLKIFLFRLCLLTCAVCTEILWIFVRWCYVKNFSLGVLVHFCFCLA